MVIKAKPLCPCGACDPENDFSDAKLSEILELFAETGHVKWFRFSQFVEALQEAGLLPQDFKPGLYDIISPVNEHDACLYEDMLNYPACADAYAGCDDIVTDLVCWLAQQAIKKGKP